MTLARATYCTREDVASVLQELASPRARPQIDRAIEAATASIENRCHRTFHPTLATKSFRWPDQNSSAWSWRIWLDASDLVSVSAITSGGATIDPADVYLEPQRYGPPYTSIEVNTGTSAAWSGGDSDQRAISITGVWGYGSQVRAAGALAANVASTTTTSVTVTDGSLIGVGDLILIGTERMIVTGRGSVTSGQTLQTPLTASNAGTAVVVTTGSAFFPGEVITLDTESMLVTDVVSNTLTVERAVNGSALAAHTGSTIYLPRVLTVIRGVHGTTAAVHLADASVSASVVPGPIRSLAIGEAIVELQQGAAGYARTAGSGDNARPIGAGAGLNDLRDQVETGYRRKARMRAV